MRRIAIHPSAEMYGSDRMFLETVTAMGDGVIAVVPAYGPLVEELEARGIYVRVLDFPILRKVEMRSPAAAARFLLRFVVSVPRFAWWIRRHWHGHVYVSTVIAPVWIYAGRLAGAQVECHVHESEPDMSRLASRVLLFPLRAAHRVIANSEDALRWIRASTSERTVARTRVVYNGVPEREAPTLVRDGARNLVVVGRLSERKGQDVAIRATAMLRDRGYDVRLTLVGDHFPGYGHVTAGLRDLVAELGLTGHVMFEGFRDDPAPFVAAADVALVPSRVEPFGLVAVEALMLARPTVVSRVGGLPEIVRDGETGRLVPPDDPAALADVVAGLLDDPEGAAALGKRGRADARARFSLDGYARRLQEAL